MSSLQSAGRLADAALAMIEDGSVVGLGSGRAATAFVHALGERASQGLHVRGLPTSQATRDLAVRLGIPLVGLDEVEAIDVTVDGADEVDPELNLIKGLGGALVREKIVAAASRRLVILVGREKVVAALGQHGVLPVEVVPFGLAFCRRRLIELGYPPASRRATGGGRRGTRREGSSPGVQESRVHSATSGEAESQPPEPRTPTPEPSPAPRFVTDNGNYILDCRVPPLPDPEEVERLIRRIPGVVGTGLFLGMADTVLVEDGDRIDVLTRP